jgi:hypothetical protein
VFGIYVDCRAGCVAGDNDALAHFSLDRAFDAAQALVGLIAVW